ncbi:MAG TPA: pyridoxamine 5'-phosphate oxidase family protein [Acetobacteraceae bacterium]|nr:pyridoxamine 5'-phosphate oxidase family protein [Acetobacteraceae bacterium]
MTDSHTITDEATLEALYGAPSEPALRKEIDYIHPHYRAFIDASPFVAVATSGPGGLDVSPRGDRAGFVAVEDAHTLLLPDRRGNNRVDTLRNLIHDPRIALLFLIPGISETLRVNGRASISVDPVLLERFPAQGKLPRSVIIVRAERVYFQCAKAVMRSELWNPDRHIKRNALPSNGTILADITRGAIDGQVYDQGAPERLRQTMY